MEFAVKLEHATGSLTHLSYCSNIHAGESWIEVRNNLTQYVPGIRDAMVNDGEFGIGLRLSAAAVDDLAQPEALTEFIEFLSQNKLYVFTINGFPYGPFHGTRVKEDVYLPDWQDAERLRYTNQLADVFAQFLPDNQVGSISTVPGAFKGRINGPDDVASMVSNLVEHVAHLVVLERKTGKVINLALEPEPCCFLETIDEAVDFFTHHLFGPQATKQLIAALGVSELEAQILLRKHLTLCLDLCHAAVEFEDPDEGLAKLEKAGITVGKLQISSGLRLKQVNPDTISALKPFDDNVYLHQVVEQHNGNINRYTDLSEAFASLGDDAGDREWRVHFHVPIFLDELAHFSSTQYFVSKMLARHKHKPISDHLEVETYTWNVLPDEMRTQSVDQAIIRELRWVMDALS
jgi:sugar phosphate isomerase/epimerase